MKKLTLLFISGLTLIVGAVNAQYNLMHSFYSAAAPRGSLVISGSTLFGMTTTGGANNDGFIFSIHIDGTNYKDIFDFNGTNGSTPEGSLLATGST